jgi:hypothetical protein
LCIAALAVVLPAAGQTSTDREISVDEVYEREYRSMVSILRGSKENDRESKLSALKKIDAAIKRGHGFMPEIHEALQILSKEGTQTRISENGRITNKMPDIRMQAARYLGQLGTEDAKKTLIGMHTDSEPMVLVEVVLALGNLASDDSKDAVDAVVWIGNANKKRRPPDGRLANAVSDTIETFDKKGIPLPSEAGQFLRY